MQPLSRYHDHGIELTPPELPDLMDVLTVHSKTYVDAYQTEDRVVPPEYHMPRDVVENFVYNTDFPERMVSNWRNAIKSHGAQKRMHVARHEDRVIGVCDTSVRPDGSGYIDAFYILPKFQRLYIGAAFLQKVFEEMGDRKINLLVTTGIPAQNFYRSFGFREVARTPEEISRDPVLAPGRILHQTKMTRSALSNLH